jgi:hypothetical protein
MRGEIVSMDAALGRQTWLTAGSCARRKRWF